MAEKCDVVIIGGGAAGLMCARVAGRRGRSVLILDHAKRPAEKIRISGGGALQLHQHAFLAGGLSVKQQAFLQISIYPLYAG